MRTCQAFCFDTIVLAHSDDVAALDTSAFFCALNEIASFNVVFSAIDSWCKQCSDPGLKFWRFGFDVHFEINQRTPSLAGLGRPRDTLHCLFRLNRPHKTWQTATRFDVYVKGAPVGGFCAGREHQQSFGARRSTYAPAYRTRVSQRSANDVLPRLHNRT